MTSASPWNPYNPIARANDLPKPGVFKSGLNNASEPGSRPGQTKAGASTFPSSSYSKPRFLRGMVWRLLQWATRWGL
eukprot:10817102-Lingulodinium_polyedra.AAC.1